MAFSQSNFGKSTASNFASSRNLFNQSHLDSPLNQPWMTRNAGLTPMGNNRRPPGSAFGASALLAQSYSTVFVPDGVFEPPFDTDAEENEYKPDPSAYGYLTRTTERAEARRHDIRSRLNSQKSFNGDKQ